MSSKSTVVSASKFVSIQYGLIFYALGILPFNENKNNDMVNIMIHAHKYVPHKTTVTEEKLPNADDTVVVAESQLHRILFGGD